MRVPISSRKGCVKSKIKKLIPPITLVPIPPYSNPPQYRRMENGIVSKVSIRTSQTGKYSGIYVWIKVWGILGSIKSIERVPVSTTVISNAPSLRSVTFFQIGRTEDADGYFHTMVEVRNPGHEDHLKEVARKKRVVSPDWTSAVRETKK